MPLRCWEKQYNLNWHKENMPRSERGAPLTYYTRRSGPVGPLTSTISTKILGLYSHSHTPVLSQPSSTTQRCFVLPLFSFYASR